MITILFRRVMIYADATPISLMSSKKVVIYTLAFCTCMYYMGKAYLSTFCFR